MGEANVVIQAAVDVKLQSRLSAFCRLEKC